MAKFLKRFLCWFNPHEVEYLENSIVLSKAVCVNCGKILCCNREDGTVLPWELGFEEHFRLIKQASEYEAKGKVK